ncbi:MAG: PTS sugar transporter subunit IIA [Litorimonas sp.]
MSFKGLFCADAILIDVHAASLKQLFQDVASCLVVNASANGIDLNSRDIINAALERERLGSTGVGNGVAVPHARIDGIDTVMTVFVRLDTPLDFNALDDRPVDLITFILAPKNAASAHLRALAKVSRLLRSQDMRQRLRVAPSAEAVFALISDNMQASAA